MDEIEMLREIIAEYVDLDKERDEALKALDRIAAKVNAAELEQR